MTDPHSPARERRHRLFLAGVALLALVSLWLSELALFAAFLTFLTWASLPELSQSQRRRWLWALSVVALVCSVGLTRFVSRYALLGMTNAGKRSVDKEIVSRLREILFAQDYAREHALIDPDGDHIGGALALPALVGSAPLRPPASGRVELLDRRYAQLRATPEGPASALNGYLFMVCLPEAESWSAAATARVDEERAEREFIALAWPDGEGTSHGKLFSIDAAERILEFSNRGERGLVYSGAGTPPPCDVATRGDHTFVAWQGKAPRDHLPGAP
ncbi:MAG TPA: hypothetical protein VI197_23770 [Polyangiaceae bacterium]